MGCDRRVILCGRRSRAAGPTAYEAGLCDSLQHTAPLPCSLLAVGFWLPASITRLSLSAVAGDSAVVAFG